MLLAQLRHFYKMKVYNTNETKFCRINNYMHSFIQVNINEIKKKKNLQLFHSTHIIKLTGCNPAWWPSSQSHRASTSASSSWHRRTPAPASRHRLAPPPSPFSGVTLSPSPKPSTSRPETRASQAPASPASCSTQRGPPMRRACRLRLPPTGNFRTIRRRHHRNRRWGRGRRRRRRSWGLGFWVWRIEGLLRWKMGALMGLAFGLRG